MRTMLPLILLAPLAACATSGVTDRNLAVPVPASAPGADTMLQRVPRRNERVRVVYPATATQPDRYTIGYLRRLSSDTVVIAQGMRTDTVALVGGRRLQAVRRSHGHTWSGVSVGLITGGVLGGVVGAATWQPCTETGFMACFLHPDRGGQTAIGAITGGLLGALVGGMIGHGTRTEEWGTVPIGGTPVTVRPARLGVSIGF